MSKSNRLNSIFEDSEAIKPKNSVKDKDYQLANFRDYVKTENKSKFKPLPFKKPIEKELTFLTKDASVINSKQKLDELDLILQSKSDSSNIKSRFNLNRNPNIQNLLQDIRTKSGVNQLQEELKNEFDLFLNASFNYSLFPKKTEWNYLTLGDYDDDLLKKNSVKSEPNIIHENSTLKEIPATTSLKPIKSAKKTLLKKENDKSEKKNELGSNMQVALIDDMKNQNKTSKPIIELNKMLESIKRIDLPKFQPELLQLCQYGGDAQLFNFYPQDLDNDLNNKQNGLGRFCIHECCVKGNITMLKGLLSYIDDVNKLDSNNQTAAHIAAKYGELECLKILLANGINLEIGDKLGMRVSHIAAQQNHTDILEFIFEIGLSLNGSCHKGKLPIHYAAEHGAFESIKLLEKYYNDISFTDNEGNTAAHLAGMNDHLKCVKYLFSLGLPVDKVYNNVGRNVAHICCLNGSVRTLHWLFENDANRSNTDTFGNTLAHSSCLGGQAECFHCCIQHDVPINQLNLLGESPLDLARKVGKSFHIEKAANNLIRCDYCVKDALRLKWEKENEKASDNKVFVVKSAKDKRKSSNKTIRLRSSFTEPDAELSRDFVAQYFGPEV